MQNPPAVAFIDFWNAAEVPFSTSTEFICWTEKQLEAIDVNFLEDNLGTTYGSMRITRRRIVHCQAAARHLCLMTTVLGAITEYDDKG
jgi:hypothetical protein